MITKKIETQEVEVIDKVICDLCGKDCCNSFGTAEHMTLKANWGFMSDHDLETWEAHVCEECVMSKLNFIKFDIKRNINF